MDTKKQNGLKTKTYLFICLQENTPHKDIPDGKWKDGKGIPCQKKGKISRSEHHSIKHRLNTKTVMRDKEGYYIMDQSNKICDYSKCILTQCEGAWLFRTNANESKGRHKPKTVTIGNINTPLTNKQN